MRFVVGLVVVLALLSVLVAGERQQSRFYTGDPLYGVAWYLHDHEGIDLNVEPVWDEGWTGAGIRIAIVDNGVHYEHPDIAPKYHPESSFDFNFNKADAKAYEWESHGTTLASLAAGARNQKCSLGVAFDAEISSIRVSSRPLTDLQEAQALRFAPADNDIYVNAWGPVDDGKRLEGPGPLARDALKNGVIKGRDGLGSIYVWASGDGHAEQDNCNYDGYVNSRYTIAVGSYGFYGGPTPYAEGCASLIVSMPASGEGRRLLSGASGVSRCEQMFSGSSGSAALAGGAIALLLQQRPDLTWRDVQGVLIESAMPVDEFDADWADNGAGYRVNHRYGFGRLDAQLMMTVAEDWELLPAEVTLTDINQSTVHIPDYGTAGEEFVSSTIQVEEDIDIESIEVSITISHRRRGQLGITLISPWGTESKLFLPHPDNTADINWTFTTMRSWAESSRGIWTLQVYDNERGVVGDLTSWILIIHGHQRSLTGQK